MTNEDTLKDAEVPQENPVGDTIEGSKDEAEFKVTVRKLEVPVRPRGVLAE